MPEQITTDPINDESSADKFGDRPALLSENPTSNEAAGVTMNTIDNADIATISEKELWAHFVDSEIPLMTALGKSAKSFRPNDLLRDPGVYQVTPDYSDEIADTINDADDPEDALNAVIEDYGTYLRNLTAIRDTFVILKSQQFIYSDGIDVIYRKPEGEAA